MDQNFRRYLVRSGMRRARLEGIRIGRPALDLDREGIFRDRRCGRSIGQIAREHSISRTTVHRVLSQAGTPVPKGL